MNSQEKTIELLEELVKWTRVTSIPKVKVVLTTMLSTPEEKMAYQQSDGKPSKEVAKLANVGHVTVTKWWKKWIRAGIAEPVSVQRGERAMRIFSLNDFGIEPQKSENVQEKLVEEKIVHDK